MSPKSLSTGTKLDETAPLYWDTVAYVVTEEKGILLSLFHHLHRFAEAQTILDGKSLALVKKPGPQLKFFSEHPLFYHAVPVPFDGASLLVGASPKRNFTHHPAVASVFQLKNLGTFEDRDSLLQIEVLKHPEAETGSVLSMRVAPTSEFDNLKIGSRNPEADKAAKCLLLATELELEGPRRQERIERQAAGLMQLPLEEIEAKLFDCLNGPPRPRCSGPVVAEGGSSRLGWSP